VLRDLFNQLVALQIPARQPEGQPAN
jgi:hypothetical protein